jgi:hypothetical protein
MDISYNPSKTFKLTMLIMVVIGVVALITGFLTDPARTWPNILLNNVFFLTISIGAMLYYSLQFVTGSSWSAMFQRIPLALGSFIPVAAVLMLLLYFGLPAIYEWAHPGITETDKLIAHKAPYLNVPFFMVRILVYFALWIPLFLALRKLSRQEDMEPGMKFYKKSSYLAKVFVFVTVLTFSLAAMDWIMTIDAHWYSTLFGFRAMVTSMYYGVAAIILLLFFLKGAGFFPKLNMAHQHDLARYLFRFSIVFGYLWFMQFLILWYANIPELTVYYQPRFLGEWKYLFYAELFMNFVIPFIVMMSDNLGRKKHTMIGISVLLIAGLWVSLFTQIMPGSYGILKFGFIEIGTWIGYAGLFIWLTINTLSKSNMIPKNHPMIEESMHHH